VRTCIKC
jgi:hypothetical protein